YLLPDAGSQPRINRLSSTLKGEIPGSDSRFAGDELAGLLKLAPIGIVAGNGFFRETVRCEQDDRPRWLIELSQPVTDPSGQRGDQRLLIMPVLNHGERDGSSGPD